MGNPPTFSADPGISLRRPAAVPLPADRKAAFDRILREEELQHKLQIQQQQLKRPIHRHQQQQRKSQEIRGDRPNRKPKKKKSINKEEVSSRQDPQERELDDEEEREGDLARDLEGKLDGLVCGDIKKDSAIYAPILRSCGKDLRLGTCVHDHIRRSGHGSDSFLGNLLVQMYGNIGRVDLAHSCFDQIPFKNVFSWNMMIAAFSRNGHPREAIALFREMIHAGARADKITFLAALDSCAAMAALDRAHEIHALIAELGLDRDLAIANSLVNAYGKCGSARDARAVFDRIAGEGDIVSWNSALAACDHVSEAIDLFHRMDCEGIKPNRVTFVAVMGSGAAAEELLQRLRHAVQGPDVVVATGLIQLYGRLGRAGDAREIFDGIVSSKKDVVLWTAMLAAFARNGQGRPALEIFREMDLEGVTPNKITMLAALEACSCLGSLAIAKAVHSTLDHQSLDLQNGSIGMFGRCGSVEAAREIFDAMESQRNLVSYTAMVAAYAQNGHFGDAEGLFRSMQLQGHAPDEVSFTCLLFAFSHAGLLQQGWEHLLRKFIERFAWTVESGKRGQVTAFSFCEPRQAGNPSQGSRICEYHRQRA
ncbi:pentatricopeptide repeat-containing protein At4g19191, mitochondrial-like [Selaginella moellendorffii]|uniref:pentatricopeptide repeat-containing protein At4g19191, mitochondrial-like n=1 Tax=Selaginella moellendorffii TaxID=88036 RepID=UPI000D1C466A|nr:pentatricopeptide repeat-containing protein At4g19191, mitochondrial-like [Selaginella moellendorffii]|eukprot:XP_024542606.1 pentatricopeptide repeat-containing protein At4g19191, mitochondrial-like [Selaginella moellendorffii]